MEFRLADRRGARPSTGRSTAFLTIDHWNDYSYVTLFQLFCFDENGNGHDIGNVKIGFTGQTESISTFSTLSKEFSELDQRYFSVGQSVDFYRHIRGLPDTTRKELLRGLNDLVAYPEIISTIDDEKVLGTSLLRDISLATIRGQFARVLNGMAELTSFNFKFCRLQSDQFDAFALDFDVIPESMPGTNIHAIIGRNGVGKTTLLNSMISAVVSQDPSGVFLSKSSFGEEKISPDYFSSVVSVSFSAFDPFTPPQEQPDPAKGACYFYIGLKDQGDPSRLRSLEELQNECVRALLACFQTRERLDRWRRVIDELGSDENFASMGLVRLHDVYMTMRSGRALAEQADSDTLRAAFQSEAHRFLKKMSSGHAVVFLTMTRLVSTVEEKTLVLLDEPESHLHPPLLAAFVRALGGLLHDRNGVAIIATHSPVVLQEIPRSCAWKIYRTSRSTAAERPKIETFGENVGTLTSEVFRLEVALSGFHKLLAESVATGQSYEEIVGSYKGQLGIEGRAVLRVLLATKEGAQE